MFYLGRFTCLVTFLLLLTAQKPIPIVEQAVFQAVLQHPPLAVYLNPAAAADQGLCILKNGMVPAQYRLFQFSRPITQLTEAVLMENQHFHYLIFTHASQTGDSARVEFQARLARVEVHLGLKKVEKVWQVHAMERIHLP